MSWGSASRLALPLLFQHLAPFLWRTGTFRRVAGLTQQLQILGIIRSTSGARQDMVERHVPEHKNLLAPVTLSLLFPIECIPIVLRSHVRIWDRIWDFDSAGIYISVCLANIFNHSGDLFEIKTHPMSEPSHVTVFPVMIVNPLVKFFQTDPLPKHEIEHVLFIRGGLTKYINPFFCEVKLFC